PSRRSMAPIAPGALAESASAKMRFLYSAEYWRRLALTTTSGSGIVLASPGATLRSASLRSASLRSAPGEAKTTEGGGTPFTDFFMSISFSALYTKSRKGRRLTDLGTEGQDGVAGATSSEFGIVLHPVAPGYIRRQGSRPASVGGIWLSFSGLVENNGSDWVRFVIWFWVRRGRTQADEHRHSLRTNMPGQSRWRAGCPSLP